MRRAVTAAALSGLLLCGCGSAETAAAREIAVPLRAEESASVVQAYADEQQTALSAFADTWAESVSCYSAAVQVLLAHEQLCRNCVYDLTAANRHSAYGALIEGCAVCDGYAEGFSVLMQAAGIPAMTVIGSACEPSGSRIAHAWNLVELDGIWYHIDCTWDDTDDTVAHTYFLCDDAAMLQDHVWAQNKYPPAESGGYRYETIVQEMMQQVLPSGYSSLG